MLALSNHEPVSSGYYRDSYQHPEYSHLILKIVRKMPEPSRRRLLQPGGTKAKDPNQLEHEMWGRLKSEGHDKSGYFIKIHGWEETDLGPALCVERLVSDAEFPPIILNLISKRQALKLDPSVKKFIMTSLDEFFGYVIRNGIYSCAWRLENLAVCRQDGVLKLMSFDTKAITIKEWLPISRYSKTAIRMKIRRKTDKLRILMQKKLYG